jgi:hypothetical protein
MTCIRSYLGLISAAALLWASACSNANMSRTGTGSAGSSSSGSAGSSSAGAGGSTSTAGAGGSAATGAGGDSGQGGSTGQAGAGGSAGAAGSGTGGSTAGAGGSTTGAAGADGGATTADGGAAYPPDPRPINVTGTGNTSFTYAGGQAYLNKNKPAQGKLVLFLGGICTGTGAGGIESFFHNYGFHTFSPYTDTCLDGGKVPKSYVTTLQTAPMDPEANRQIGDSRMELWDGKSRVTWYTVDPGKVILTATIGMLKQGQMMDPDGDWGFFLNADGTLRTSDVWVVGYSWGSQTWAMISAYVPFGRVITTSGPQNEGFPNATWITSKSVAGTPGDRKYMLIGFNSPYPSTSANDAEVTGMVTTVMNAGWPGTMTNVTPTSPGPYTSTQHLFSMVGSAPNSPGGHTIFCTGSATCGWNPLCDYVTNVQ